MFQFISRVYFLGVNIRKIKLYLCQLHQLSKPDKHAELKKFFVLFFCFFFLIRTVSVPLQSLLCNKHSTTNFPQVL